MTPEAPRRLIVEFGLDEGEMAAMDYAGPRVAGPRNYVVFAAPVDPNWEPIPGGEPKLELYVEAGELLEGRDAAVELYREMRAQAQLPPAEPRIVGAFWENGEWPLAERFIDEAYDLLEQQRWEMAVVAVQVACEVDIRRVFELAAEAEQPPLAALALRSVRFYTLMDGHARRAFEAITGLDPAKADCWTAYHTHVERRNNIVHRGAQVTRAEALRSRDAVDDMREWVAQASRAP